MYQAHNINKACIGTRSYSGVTRRPRISSPTTEGANIIADALTAYVSSG
jgi:hypothetical protein